MILKCATLEKELNLELDKVFVLEIAAPALLARVIRSFVQLAEGEEPLEAFYLASRLEILPASRHLVVLTDPFHLELNSRRLQGRLYKQVEALANQDPQWLHSFQSRKEQLLAQFDALVRDLGVDVERDEGDSLADFCKYVNLRIAMDVSQPLLAQLQTCLDVMAEWMPGQTLVFCNLLSLLSPREREELFRYALFTKVKLLLIEPFTGSPLRLHELRWVIAEDFDEQLMM